MDYASFVYNAKTYILDEDHFLDMLEDEEKKVSGIDVQEILKLLMGHEDVDFHIEYFTSCCDSCHAGKAEKEKRFKFLEYHFYLFTKEGSYVMSSLSKEYEGKRLSSLIAAGVVDDSCLVSVQVCENCGDFAIELSACDF